MSSSRTSSVVIATRHRPVLLARCLAAIDRLSPGPDEVVVVDNSLGDEQTSQAAAKHGAAYVVEPVEGLSRARNTGARKAAHDVLAFIDDDAVPEPSWLASILHPFADQRVMAATGRFVPLDVTAPAQQRSVSSGWLDFGTQRRSIDQNDSLWYELSNFGGLGSGSNMAFRREAFDAWPGFRESIGRGKAISGCEEHYAFFQLLKLGYRVAYAPDAIVAHPHPATMHGLVNLQRRTRSETFAYATMLLVEEPGYRLRTLRYLLRRAAGKAQPWAASDRPVTERLVRRRDIAAAAILGPLLYVRSRREGRPGPASLAQP